MKSNKSLYEFFTLIELLIFYLVIGYTIDMVIWMFGYLGCGIFYSLHEGQRDPQEVAIVCLLAQVGIHLFFFLINLYLLIRGRVPKEIPKHKIIYFLATVVCAIVLIAVVMKSQQNNRCEILLSPDDSGLLFASIISLITNILYVRKTHQSLGMSLLDFIKK